MHDEAEGGRKKTRGMKKERRHLGDILFCEEPCGDNVSVYCIFFLLEIASLKTNVKDKKLINLLKKICLSNPQILSKAEPKNRHHH